MGSARGWHRAAGGGVAFGGLSKNKGNPWAERRSQNHQTCVCPGWHLVGCHQRGLAAPTELNLPGGASLWLAGTSVLPPNLPQPPRPSAAPTPSPLTRLVGTNVPAPEPGKWVFTYCSNVEDKDRGRFDAGEGEEGEEEGCRWKTKEHALVPLPLTMIHLEFPFPSGQCPSPATAHFPWPRGSTWDKHLWVQRGPSQGAAQAPRGTHRQGVL